MKWLKQLKDKFFKKKEVIPEEEKQDIVPREVIDDEIERRLRCYFCEERLGEGGSKKIEGFRIHHKCYRYLERKIRQEQGLPRSGRMV